MTGDVVHTGGCQCGRVRYALHTKADGAFCHCRMCQRATGGVFAALAWVPKTEFVWTRGDPARFSSSSLAERAYCRDCGTPLTFTYHHTDGTNVTIGSLDDPESVSLTMHHGVESRVSWLRLSDGLPEERTGEDDAAGRLASMVSHQAGEA